MNENDIGKVVIGAAVLLRRERGPGLLETVYDIRLGYLLNFGEALMRDGITRTVNDLKE